MHVDVNTVDVFTLLVRLKIQVFFRRSTEIGKIDVESVHVAIHAPKRVHA